MAKATSKHLHRRWFLIQAGSNKEPCRIEACLDELILEQKQFACIYADVAWEFRNRSSRAAAENHYRTMQLSDVMAMPVGLLAAENAHLHLWAPNALLPDCLQVIEAWGFTYKTNFVWAKPQMGMGNYWRSSHELLLLGVRGSLPFLEHHHKSWQIANRTEHSTKPDLIRSLVEQVSPGPYLELFSRRTCPGWTMFGNQVERWLF